MFIAWKLREEKDEQHNCTTTANLIKSRLYASSLLPAVTRQAATTITLPPCSLASHTMPLYTGALPKFFKNTSVFSAGLPGCYHNHIRSQKKYDHIWKAIHHQKIFLKHQWYNLTPPDATTSKHKRQQKRWIDHKALCSQKTKYKKLYFWALFR